MSLWSLADCISAPRLDAFAVGGLILGLAAGFLFARLRFKAAAADRNARRILIIGCALMGLAIGGAARVALTGQC
jgi:hypothetical protein